MIRMVQVDIHFPLTPSAWGHEHNAFYNFTKEIRAMMENQFPGIAVQTIHQSAGLSNPGASVEATMWSHVPNRMQIQADIRDFLLPIWRERVERHREYDQYPEEYPELDQPYNDDLNQVRNHTLNEIMELDQTPIAREVARIVRRRGRARI